MSLVPRLGRIRCDGNATLMGGIFDLINKYIKRNFFGVKLLNWIDCD